MNSRSKIFMTKLCSLTHIVRASNSTCRWSFNTPLEDESKIQRGAGQDFPFPKISENSWLRAERFYVIPPLLLRT